MIVDTKKLAAPTLEIDNTRRLPGILPNSVADFAKQKDTGYPSILRLATDVNYC